MSAQLTLAAARAAGIAVTVVGGDLKLEADRRPPEAILEAIRRDKSEIIRLKHRGPDGWSGEDWLAYFDERSGILEFDGDLSRANAERAAFDECVNQWMAQNAPPVPAEHLCIRCNEPTGITDPGLALTDGERNAWIHANCQEPFLRECRAQALKALAQFGIPPVTRQPERSEGNPTDTTVPFE